MLLLELLLLLLQVLLINIIIIILSLLPLRIVSFKEIYFFALKKCKIIIENFNNITFYLEEIYLQKEDFKSSMIDFITTVLAEGVLLIINLPLIHLI